MKNSIEAAYKAYPLTDENKNNTNINAKCVRFQQEYEQAEQDLNLKQIDVKDKFSEKLEGEIVSDYVYVTNGNQYDIMRYEFNEKIWLDYANDRHWGITH